MFEKIISFFNGIVDAFENLRPTKVNEETTADNSKNSSEADSFPKVDVSNVEIPKSKKEYNDKKRENER